MAYFEADDVNRILDTLSAAYPDAGCGLEFGSPYELLVATVLSAQCTDKRVNAVGKVLFALAPTPEKMLALGQERLEGLVKSCGLYRAKSKNILALSGILVSRYESQPPSDFASLCALPGVGRKTANVVMSNAFGQAAIAVDTHVFRVSNRIGLAEATDVYRTEMQLVNAIPEARQSLAHHLLIRHGRQVCSARKPNCLECCVSGDCRAFGEGTLQSGSGKSSDRPDKLAKADRTANKTDAIPKRRTPKAKPESSPNDLPNLK